MVQLPFLQKKVSHYDALAQKWTDRHKELQAALWNKHGEVLDWFIQKPKTWMLSSLVGFLLMSSSGNLSSKITPAYAQEQFLNLDKKTFFFSDLYNILPHEIRPLTLDEEQKVANLLTSSYGLKVTPQLDGIRLNRTYGYIGEEQHLALYPGDTMDTHFDNQDDARKYWSSGMAPGLGAWGYFASSQSQLTQEERLREKYYIAVETFLSPGYMEHVAQYNTFFKYRKMLVVNPNNGKAIVADIADAGPSEWTGKSFGGSPEVMQYLGREDGAAKGAVLIFFIDDPLDQVQLGPVSLSKI